MTTGCSFLKSEYKWKGELKFFYSSFIKIKRGHKKKILSQISFVSTDYNIILLSEKISLRLIGRGGEGDQTHGAHLICVSLVYILGYCDSVVFIT